MYSEVSQDWVFFFSGAYSEENVLWIAALLLSRRQRYVTTVSISTVFMMRLKVIGSSTLGFDYHFGLQTFLVSFNTCVK